MRNTRIPDITARCGAADAITVSWRGRRHHCHCGGGGGGIVVPGPGCRRSVIVICGAADAIVVSRWGRRHRRRRHGGGGGGIVVPGPGCRHGIAALLSSSWRWWWLANAVAAAALSSSRWWWWWHRQSVASLNSMPASQSGRHRRRAWRVAQRAGGLCNKSAVELSENFNLTSYWYSYTSLNKVFVNFCGVMVDVFSSYCFWKSRVRFPNLNEFWAICFPLHRVLGLLKLLVVTYLLIMLV